MYNVLKFISNVIFRLFFRIKIHGNNKLPDGRLIICSNHISALDPIILAISTNRKISFLAKKELFKNKFFSKFLYSIGAIPINRDALDIRALKESINILQEEKVLGIFPEGTRIKSISEENIKSGIGLISSRAKSNIQPVFIKSDYKLFSKIEIFYRDIIRVEDYIELEDKNKEIALATYRIIYDVESENI